VDEWGFDQKSGIDECYLQLDDTERRPAMANPEYAGRADAIGQKSDPPVHIKSGGTGKTVSEGPEVHRSNSEHYIEFAHPSSYPVVRVEAPEAFQNLSSFTATFRDKTAGHLRSPPSPF
jgi:hypothetical protein